jgi:hypothetical protein
MSAPADAMTNRRHALAASIQSRDGAHSLLNRRGRRHLLHDPNANDRPGGRRASPAFLQALANG